MFLGSAHKQFVPGDLPARVGAPHFAEVGCPEGELAVAVSQHVKCLHLGACAGTIAVHASQLLAEQVFALGFELNPWIWILGLGGGALGIGLAGMAAVYPLLSRPPVEILRRA